MKKWLSMFLAAVMLCGVLAGCGGTQSGSTPASGAQSASAAGDSNVNAEGFPIVNEPITLRGMVALNANVKDWNEHPALKRMEGNQRTHHQTACFHNLYGFYKNNQNPEFPVSWPEKFSDIPACRS